MISVRRASPTTRLVLTGMASAEPWTLRRLGSAQVFQAGETLDGLPLRDYQHPHDLVMALDGRFDWNLTATTQWFVSAGVVGSPALGPTPFMHRASADVHPTAPLSHHMLDSTHITHGVVTAGVTRHRWGAEVSAFRGREPDEDRVRLDMGALDSVAGRVSWSAGPWRTQVSAGWLTSPEPLEPGDAFKTTASVEYSRPHGDRRRGLAWTMAVGRNGRTDHAEWGGLVEGAVHVGPSLRIYTRVELVDRFILVDFEHAAAFGEERHLRSRIGAWMFGITRDVWRAGPARASLGADVTLHRTPANLSDSYGSPVSVHAYLRVSR